MEKEILNNQLLNIPEDFKCPITRDLMEEPVLIADGHSYEESAIFYWFQIGHRTSPLTGEELGHMTLTKNYALKKAINSFKEKLPLIQRENQIKTDLSAAIKLREEMISNYFMKKDFERDDFKSNFIIKHDLSSIIFEISKINKKIEQNDEFKNTLSKLTEKMSEVFISINCNDEIKKNLSSIEIQIEDLKNSVNQIKQMFFKSTLSIECNLQDVKKQKRDILRDVSKLANSWDLEAIENWNEYMKQIGVNYVTKKAFESFDLKSINECEESVLEPELICSHSNKSENKIEFIETTTDGKIFKFKINFEGIQSKTHHLKSNSSKEKIDVKLIATIKSGSIIAKRIYTKIT